MEVTMETTAFSSVSPQAIPPGAFACGLIQQTFCLIYICNGRAIQREVNDDPPVCITMGDKRRKWSDARRYCRSFGGALYTSDLDHAAIYNKNGVKSLWSGYYKQNDKALQETSTTPVGASYDANLWKVTQLVTLGVGEQCALYTFDRCPSSRKGTGAGGRGQSSPGCRDKFQLLWKSCSKAANFACEIPARPLTSFDIQSNKTFSINKEFGFQMYFTSSKSAQTDVASACKAVDPRGSVFSISNPGDRTVLKFVARNVRRYRSSLDISQDELRTALFWVNNQDSTRCEALSLDQNFTTDHMTSWPCHAKLRVLCKTEDVIYETKPPVLLVRDPEDVTWVKTNRSVSLPSGILLSALSSGRRERGDVMIDCRTSLTSELQNLTLYIDDQRAGSTKGNKQNGPFEQDFSMGLYPVSPSDLIDLVGHYHCKVNDLKTHGVLESNRLFIRPSDLEIYVALFRLKRPQAQQDWQELSQYLEFDGSTARSGAGLTLVTLLDDKFDRYGGYSVKPLALKSRSLTLVAYVYKKFDVPPHHTHSQSRPELQNLNGLQSFANTAVGLESGSLKIESVTLKRLDDCLATNNAQLPIPDACG